MFDPLRGKRVTVMGLGRFGGGVGAVRHLAQRGARLTVTDLAEASKLEDSLKAIADLKLDRVRLGGHDAADFRDADLIVASPAVSLQHPLLRSATCPVTTEIGLFWSRCRGRVIAVTGTVGKSTTAALIHAVLCESGLSAWLGGNIGDSLLPDIDRIGPTDWVVLELSSFQLEYLAPLRPRAEISVVTNFRPNHLDRHGTLDAYRAAKQLLLTWQSPEDVAVLNRDDPDVAQWPTAASKRWFGDRRSKQPLSISSDQATVDRGSGELVFTGVVPSEKEVRIPFRNATGPRGINAAAAAAVAVAIGVDPDSIATALNDFRGLPHRCEQLGELQGRVWINDSKATTPEAAAFALAELDRPIRLIAGGADKGVDLQPLVDAIRDRCPSVYLSGQTAHAIGKGLGDSKVMRSVHATFDESVLAAWGESSPGEVILLSPGCASWGQFRDYRERGERFRAIKDELTRVHNIEPRKT